MNQSLKVSCRVDYWPMGGNPECERTSVLDFMSGAEGSIRAQQLPESGTLELRIHLPGSDSPLRIDHAKITWGHWGAFTVEFVSMSTEDRQRLEDYLVTV